MDKIRNSAKINWNNSTGNLLPFFYHFFENKIFHPSIENLKHNQKIQSKVSFKFLKRSRPKHSIFSNVMPKYGQDNGQCEIDKNQK